MEELETQPAGDSPEQGENAPEQNEPNPPEAAVADTAEALPDGGDPDASVSAEELLANPEAEVPDVSAEDAHLKAMLEAIVYVTEEPLTVNQIAAALQHPADRIRLLLDQLVEEFERPSHGVTIKEVAGGYKMATKAEHHEAVRNFVKSLKAPLKLSLPALETLAVIAYKQPVTGPEIMEIRGVQGGGVMKTLLDRKLIAVAGRKNVIGKPMLYKTTREFLVQFGLKDLSELPSLKEFEEIRRMAFSDEPQAATPEPAEPSRPEADGAVREAAPEPAQSTPDPEAAMASEAEEQPGPPSRDQEE